MMDTMNEQTNKTNQMKKNRRVYVCVCFPRCGYECVFCCCCCCCCSFLCKVALLKRVEQTLVQNFTWSRINDFCFIKGMEHTLTRKLSLSLSHTHKHTRSLLKTLKIHPGGLLLLPRLKRTCCQSRVQFDNFVQLVIITNTSLHW